MEFRNQNGTIVYFGFFYLTCKKLYFRFEHCYGHFMIQDINTASYVLNCGALAGVR